MDEYRILPIDRSHNERMISILRGAPINSGLFTVCFDKSPDIFAIPRMKYSDCMHLGFFRGDELKGFASLGYHDALIGGRIEKIFCLFHFYVMPEARGRHFSEKALEIFLDDISGKANFGYCLTLKGNRQVEILVGRQLHGQAPASAIAGDLIIRSVIFSLPKRNRTVYSVRNATINDIPDIVRLLNTEQEKRDMGQVYTENTFSQSITKRMIGTEDYYMAVDRAGRNVGTCLAWDCSSFRRTRVIKFSPKFYPLLYTYRILEKILPMAPLPAEGECFSELTVTDCAAEGRNPAIIHALLTEVYHRNLNRKYHFMNFGSCSGDPLLDAAKGFMFTDVTSSIIFISLDRNRFRTELNLPCVDIAYL